MNIEEASKYSIYNSSELSKSSKAGCYYCLNVFNTSEISEWVDDDTTALCPKCGIDSVLPETSPYALDKETLSELHKYWF